MSSDAGSAALPYSLLTSVQAVVYCNVASAAMLFYEHGITLGDEIDHIWKRRWTGATLLFMLNRYATLLKSILGFFTLFNYDPHVCRNATLLYNLFDIIALFVFAAFSSFRVWAIWGRELRPFLIVLPFTLITPCLNAYRVSKAETGFDYSLPRPWGGCQEGTTLPLHLYIAFSDIVRSVSIATDALVLVMTWMKTRSIYVAARRARIGTGISELLIRDGTLYFGVLLLINVVDLIVNHTSANFNPVNYFNDVINCILISRFILNLRAANSNPWERAAGQSSSLITQGQLEFIETNVLGDLGAPIVYARPADSDVDGDDEEMEGEGQACSRLEEEDEFERENGPLASGLRRRTSHAHSHRSSEDWARDEYYESESQHSCDNKSDIRLLHLRRPARPHRRTSGGTASTSVPPTPTLETASLEHFPGLSRPSESDITEEHR